MKIWAHRGASGEYPENTLLAFEHAIKQNADGIELDVYQVEDEFYVWHDRVIPLFADTLIWQLTKHQVQQVQLHHKQHIPTLAEALQAIAGRVEVNIELKRIADVTALVQVIEQAVRQTTPAESLLISSFNHHYLAQLAQSGSNWRLGLLTASSPLDMAFTCNAMAVYSIHFDVNCLRPEDIELAHRLGLKVYVYTVDRQSELQWLKDWGVDGVFSNFPANARAFIEQL
ncbi:glycerophosphodiester phosphodiesterase [Planctobacterium marinum]|uniref:Glycerophosphoryl diester phosphodiesterase n=1 Tax=Planctobacterium marinum TaxID=1631968 RepID=A0AA48HRP8_9ALTE|nr:glycerophosphoryl diester phosphodiesterase [Planctobacterium marinum]